MNLNHWRDIVHHLAKEKGWHDRAQSVAEAIALQHSELSEALEEYRNGKEPNEIYQEATPQDGLKPCGIPIELADAIIRILDFCGLHNIDIENAVAQKHAFNARRAHRHGGKVL